MTNMNYKNEGERKTYNKNWASNRKHIDVVLLLMQWEKKNISTAMIEFSMERKNGVHEIRGNHSIGQWPRIHTEHTRADATVFH